MVNINCKYLVHIKLLLKIITYVQILKTSRLSTILDETKRKSVINSDVNVTVKDKIMTLSTCEDAYSETTKRIVVVAKIIKVS